MSAIEIRGLDHLVLRVAQLERSIRFYCDVLGCAEERRIEKLGLVPDPAENPETPRIIELEHRRADPGCAGLAGAVREDDNLRRRSTRRRGGGGSG